MDTIAVGLIALLAFIARLRRLGSPGGIFFDEFYAVEACRFVQEPASLCGPAIERGLSHPPLGKWLIAFGIQVFGFTPKGWRIAAVGAGVLSVVVLFMLGRKLLGSTMAATLAAGLLAIDPLHFVFSRMAMLDIFVTLFVLVAVLFVVYDRDRPRAPPSQWDPQPKWMARYRWRIAAGVAIGAAGASKWSGWFILPALLVLTVTWEIGVRRSDGQGEAVRRMLREEGPSLTLSYLLIPLVVYAATFVARVDGSLLALPWSEGSWLRSVWEQQQTMFRSLVALEGAHPYSSTGWSWPLLKRPVSLYFVETPDGRYAEILAVGNPIVWWPGLLALVYVAIRWLRARSGRAADSIIVVSFIGTYVPWLVGSPGREQYFLYYFLPSVPFLILALASVCRDFWTRLGGKVGVAILTAAAVAFFMFSYPILIATPLSYDSWETRILFRDCDGLLVADGSEAGMLRPTNVPGPPPDGWCWV